jgi:hypothetical protein
VDKDSAHEFCNRWLAAWTGNRPDDLIEFYSRDAFYSDPARPSGLRGRDELLLYFRKILARSHNWIWEVEKLISTETGFVLKWRAVIPTPKGIARTKGLDIVEITQERIIRNEVYFDRLSLENTER